MAVSSEHLGKQVRCPHCQQVVIAPAPPAPTPQPAAPSSELTETLVQPPAPGGDPEDIFATTEVTEDLFGQLPPPRLEMPPDAFATTPASANALQPPQPEATLASTAPFVPALSELAAPGRDDKTAVMPPSSEEASWMSGTRTEVEPSPPAAELPTTLFQEQPSPTVASPTRAARPSDAKVPWFMLVVFFPLLLYAIVISIFSFLLYQHYQDVEQRLRRHFELMPDEGDKPGVEKGKKLTWYKYEPRVATMPLPDNLCTTLGKSLTIGTLQVTPRRVERQRVRVVVENTQPEPCAGDSLVLYLNLKNLSAEYAFAPLDNYFDRRWKPGKNQLPPFTQLEVGKERFYGGPADWFPRGDPNNKREWVEGRKDLPAVLQPGEQKEYFVCTDGNDPRAVAMLFGEDGEESYHGPFLWRIRLRRGLVHVGDKDYSATAVVGVRFTDKDIHDARIEAQ
jgi:hypothetical protein